MSFFHDRRTNPSVILGHRPHGRAQMASRGAQQQQHNCENTPPPLKGTFLFADRPAARQKSPGSALDLFPALTTPPISRIGNGVANTARRNSNERSRRGDASTTSSSSGLQSARTRIPGLMNSLDEFGDPVSHVPSPPRSAANRDELTSSGARRNSLLFTADNELDRDNPFPLQATSHIPIVVEDDWKPLIPPAVTPPQSFAPRSRHN